MQLDIHDISARYGARIVFQSLSLSLQYGEVLVISGSNGSGKSTLLRLLCGLQQPASGTLWYTYNGIQYTPYEANHLIGWVSPDLILYRELTGYENLRFFARVRGLDQNDTALDQLLTHVGLGQRGYDPVSCYSSGMVQRLRYAFALLHQPRILLLDEPTVMLDEHGNELVEHMVQAQRQHGMTIIATNDPRELRFGDYVLTLHGTR